MIEAAKHVLHVRFSVDEQAVVLVKVWIPDLILIRVACAAWWREWLIGVAFLEVVVELFSDMVVFIASVEKKVGCIGRLMNWILLLFFYYSFLYLLYIAIYPFCWRLKKWTSKTYYILKFSSYTPCIIFHKVRMVNFLFYIHSQLTANGVSNNSVPFWLLTKSLLAHDRVDRWLDVVRLVQEHLHIYCLGLCF